MSQASNGGRHTINKTLNHVADLLKKRTLIPFKEEVLVSIPDLEDHQGHPVGAVSVQILMIGFFTNSR